MDDFRLSEISNEENENDENKINTNPNNASFTVETLLNSREDYDKCIEKYDQETLKRFCFLYADNNIEKLTNKISPYMKKRVTWATLYEKVFRKIFFPFSFKNGEQYVTLEEIYDRINLIIHGEINNKYRSGYITKEEKNSIPSIINYFSYNNLQTKKNDKKNENEEKVDYMKNLFSKKKKMKNYKKMNIQKKQILNISEKNEKSENQINNTYKSKNTKNSSDDLIKLENKNKIKKPNVNYKRLSAFNLDHLQRVYDSLNRQDNKINNPQIQTKKRLSFKEKKLNQSQSSNSIINNENLNNSKNIQNTILKNEDNNSNTNKNNEETVNNNNQKQMIVTEKTNKTLDSIITKKKYTISKEDEKEIRNIPRREIVKKNIYKKVEKLAYKDELDYFNRANLKTSIKDKIFCSITPMINFIGENNIPDRDSDLKKRGDNLLSFKQMADDIMNIIHN